MIRYIIRRLLALIPVLIIVALAIFTLMYFVPGDPATIALGDTADQATILAAREAMGLNRPYIVRLAEYLEKLFLHFDFGVSYTYGTVVGDELMNRFPHTLTLAICCTLFTVIFGIPLGVRSAVKAGKFEDEVTRFLTLLFSCMPGFWLALLLVLLFALKLKWFPSSGYKSAKYFVLPVLSNSLGSLAGITRQTRASMLEVIRSDYVVTARSKGLPERKVIYGHALPNALIPIVTNIGTRFGFMLGGTTITETIFSIPGIGSYMITSINSRDYNAVQGSIIYLAFMFSFMMLVVDCVYAFIDPRIKAQYTRKKRKAAE